jgi:trk system potassium uptake protein TrkA
VYILIAGGGKVGANLTRSVLDLGHEVTLIEQRRDRWERLEEEFEHRAQLGDATELFVLERAGIARPPDLVVAVTGDDEDNIVICQMAREHYGVEKVIARVNDPRNQPLFELTGISPTVSATSIILAMIEHEVPEHGLIHLLEIVEVQLGADSPSVGKQVSRIQLPTGSRLITVMRDGQAQMAEGEIELRAGDQVLAVLEPGKEEELRKVLLRKGG